MAALDQTRPPSEATDWSSLALASTAALPADDALRRLKTSAAGLSHDEARARLERVGPNALRSHGARPLAVLVRQLRNPLPDAEADDQEDDQRARAFADGERRQRRGHEQDQHWGSSTSTAPSWRWRRCTPNCVTPPWRCATASP